MGLKDIIGQDKAVKILLKTIQRDKISSSYLFAGEAGIGKKYTAINFSKAVNCLNRYGYNQLTAPLKNIKEMSKMPIYTDYQRADSCDVCSSCKKIEKGVHPDFSLILPEAGQIRIEEIRRINELLFLKPFEGRKKTVIVDDADLMNQNAANAFLKTLEEPPEDSLIILISTNPDRLPETIRSRCTRINFTPLSIRECMDVIKKVIEGSSVAEQKTGTKLKDIEKSMIANLARLSMGKPGLIVTEDLVEDRNWSVMVLKSMLNAEKDMWSSREEMGKWFEHILLILRDMAVLKITKDEKYLINRDIKEDLLSLSRPLKLKIIIETYQKLFYLNKYLHFNLNKSLTWNYTGSLLRNVMEARYA